MKLSSFLLLTMTVFFLYSGAAADWEYCRGYPKEACTKEYNPHCGSDGVTYANKCFFCNAYIESGKVLKLSHLGKC